MPPTFSVSTVFHAISHWRLISTYIGSVKISTAFDRDAPQPIVLQETDYIISETYKDYHHHTSFAPLAVRGESRILVWEGHWQRVWGTDVSPRGVRQRMLCHDAKDHLRTDKKVHTDCHCIMYHYNLTHSSFPAIFVLKYKMQTAGSRASEMVHNGSRA